MIIGYITWLLPYNMEYYLYTLLRAFLPYELVFEYDYINKNWNILYNIKATTYIFIFIFNFYYYNDIIYS